MNMTDSMNGNISTTNGEFLTGSDMKNESWVANGNTPSNGPAARVTSHSTHNEHSNGKIKELL